VASLAAQAEAVGLPRFERQLQGHLFPMQQAGWVAQHLRSFLTSLEESAQ